MKKKIFIIILLVANVLCAQESVYIEYKVKIADEDIFKNNGYLRTLFEIARKEADLLQFGLICKKNESYFYQIENLSKEGQSINDTSLIFAGYTGEILQQNGSLFRYSNLLGNNIYVEEKSQKNWNLTNESKFIDGYECFKATSVYKVINGEKEFNHPVIAWFCPTIPYNFGPSGYSGLPGLILELQVRNVTFGVETIDFNSKKDFEINKKTMKILDEEEYKKALDKFNDFDAK